MVKTPETFIMSESECHGGFQDRARFKLALAIPNGHGLSLEEFVHRELYAWSLNNVIMVGDSYLEISILICEIKHPELSSHTIFGFGFTPSIPPLRRVYDCFFLCLFVNLAVVTIFLLVWLLKFLISV